MDELCPDAAKIVFSNPLPDGIAAMVAPQLYIQELCAVAAAEGDRDAAVQAIALEPCVGRVELAEAVFEDLFQAERQWLGDVWGPAGQGD